MTSVIYRGFVILDELRIDDEGGSSHLIDRNHHAVGPDDEVGLVAPPFRVFDDIEGIELDDILGFAGFLIRSE